MNTCLGPLPSHPVCDHGYTREHPDRPGDRDQQQAAKFVRQYGPPACGIPEVAAALTKIREEARAEEAARWQAKIEALADELDREAPDREAWDGNEQEALREAARRIRVLLDAK